MAKRSRMSILKRQRELKKSEKAALKRAKRHGASQPGLQEPRPTIASAELFGLGHGDDDASAESSARDDPGDESRG